MLPPLPRITSNPIKTDVFRASPSRSNSGRLPFAATIGHNGLFQATSEAMPVILSAVCEASVASGGSGRQHSRRLFELFWTLFAIFRFYWLKRACSPIHLLMRGILLLFNNKTSLGDRTGRETHNRRQAASSI